MRLPITLALLLASACVDTPAMVLLEIDPAAGSPTEDTPVEIRGINFFLHADPAFNAEDGVVETTYRATLGGVALREVSWKSPSLLSAVVPAGMAAGSHTLIVSAADDRRAELDDAFRVEDIERERIIIESADPPDLISDGADRSLITARVESADGTELPGRQVSFVTSGSGTLGAVSDLGDGRYTVWYTGSAAAAPSRDWIVATVATPSGPVRGSVAISLLPPCDGDHAVSTWPELAAAVAVANDAEAHQIICIQAEAAIDLGETLLLSSSNGVTLRGEARSRLDGAGLPSGVAAIEATSSGNIIEGIRLSDAPIGVQLSSQANVLRHSILERCWIGVEVVGHDNVVGPGNEIFACSEVALLVGGDDAIITGNALHGTLDNEAIRLGSENSVNGGAITFNRLFDNDCGILLQDVQDIRIDNNTFAYNAGPAVEIREDSEGILLRNNIFAWNPSAAIVAEDDNFRAPPGHNDFFMSGTACSACALGPGNLFSDPLFVAPGSRDFRLSSESPCIDAGINVGEPYLGAAPDIGAFEVQ